MKVLLIKLSSMGDVIHALPALTDAANHTPGLQVDWLVEEGFSEIPAWHPAVNRIIPISLRRWRNNLWKAFSSGEVNRVFSLLRKENYDLVIDAQGLLKSSLIGLLTKGKVKVGFTAASCREFQASFFYNKKIGVANEQHAINKMRQLFSNTFGYKLQNEQLDFGIDWSGFEPFTNERPYCLFFHGTTWETKHWSESYWLQLAKIVEAAGFDIQVTWANHEQKARVHAMAEQVRGVKILPHLTLTEAASVIQGATGVVAVDTGFGHLSSAMGKPTVSLYGPTDPLKVGAIGDNQIHLQSKLHCAPCQQKACQQPKHNLNYSPCFQELTPNKVWHALEKIIAPEIEINKLPAYNK